MELFGNWLLETADLQREAYGREPVRLPPPEWLEYVRNQTLAAFVELGEFIQNLSWKPWARAHRKPDDAARNDAVEELVDVLHFTANCLIALGVSDEELNTAYVAKMNVNRARMAAGGH